MIQYTNTITATLSLFVLGVFAYGQPLDAQEHFIGEGQSVNRVIKLRTYAVEKTVPKKVVTETPRSAREMRDTKPVANPSQIQFDEIEVPRALQDTSGPIVKRPGIGSTNKQVESLNSFPAQSDFASSFSNSFSAGSSEPPILVNNKRTNSSPNVGVDDKPEHSLSKRTNMVSAEIKAPSTVNVNQSVKLEIHLHNEGKDTVDNVKLVATLPGHAKFVSSTPQPTSAVGQTYEFDISRLGGGRTQQVLLNVVPTEKLPLEIATQIRLENSQRTMVAVQQPELTMKIEGPEQTTIGQMVTHVLVITNVGDGIARDIRLESLFPAGLRQEKKSEIVVIPAIQPGRTRRIPYQSRALEPGQSELKVSANTQTTDLQHAAIGIDIYQPELRVSAVGPRLNFVERDGIYTITVDNTGEVDVTDVRVSLNVPDGMKVTTISRQAAVDAEEGTLIWMFDTLSAKSNEQIQLKATALEEGQQVCKLVVKSNETLEKEFRLATQVTTRADLKVNIVNQTGPVQVGGKAEFLVEVQNQGSRQANEINVQIALPDSLMAVKNEQNVGLQSEHSLAFNEPHVAPGETITFRFAAVGVIEGEQVVRSTLEAAGSKRKVISEDSVYVYEVDEARVSEALSPVIPR